MLNEADIPTEPKKTEEEAWFSKTNENEGWARYLKQAEEEEEKTACSLGTGTNRCLASGSGKRNKNRSTVKKCGLPKEERLKGKKIFPPENEIFNAFKQTPYNQVKVVLMGQDPYHGEGQAHGLCFSVQKGMTPPPSLKNIYKEMEQDLGILPANHGCLLNWSKQGVLMLNATLTVRKGEPKSHYGRGWEIFTDGVIRKLCQRKAPLVFILWGKNEKA